MASGSSLLGSSPEREILILANPKAGARSGRPLVDEVAEILRQRGFVVEVTTDIERLAQMATEAQRRGALHAIAAAGGDGTVGLAVNVASPQTPIAVIPLGTENLFAKYLGVPADARAICETMLEGPLVQLDAGRANGRIFLLMAGCGFDAEVVRRLHRERRGHIHHFSYAKPIFDSIRSYEYPELRVYFERAAPPTPNIQRGERSFRADSSETPAAGMLKGRWAFIVNLPRYAGGLSLIPDADGADGLLDVCTFAHGSLWNGLMYLGGVWLGQHRSWSDFESVQATRVRIEADVPDVPYQLDGDPGGVLPLEVEALPRRITVLAPPAFAERQSRVVAGKPGA